MKVQVTLQVPSKSVAMKTLDLVIFATDTVSQVKGRISSATTLPSQEQQLVFQGKVLQDDRKLADCGVQEGSSLDFVTKGCEVAFVSQLFELLQGKHVTIEELCLLYAHKHGTSSGQVLEALGFEGGMKEYLKLHKRFVVDNGYASIAREDITLHLVKVATPGAFADCCSEDAPATKLDVVVALRDTISAVKANVAAVIDVPKAFPDLHLSIDGKFLDNNQTLSACGLKDGSQLELYTRASEASLASQLTELLTAHAVQGSIAIEKLGFLYTCKYGATAEEAIASFSTMTGKRGLRNFLVQQTQRFTVQGTLVNLVAHSGGALAHERSQHEKCLDLHDRVSSTQFRTQIAQAVTRITAVVMELPSLRIHHVVTGGSVGKGTAIEGDATAEVTVFLEELPQSDQEQWPAGLLETVTKDLRDLVLEDMPAIQVANIGNHGLRLTCDGFPDVDLWISPVFETHSKALDVLAVQSTELQPRCSSWLSEQQVRFMRKQPEPVKVTARLLKWWRNQRQWSSTATRPSDLLLELLAVHVALQLPVGKSYDQESAIGLSAAVMTRFDTVRITWQSACYGRHKVAGEILNQLPLLMDPCNPFVNVASPATFDPRELMAYAKESPHLLL